MASTMTHGRSDGHSMHKCFSALHEEDAKRTREESPETSILPCERGCSLHCKSKSDLQCPTLSGKQHLGSRSFTPMERPCSRSETTGRWHSQSLSTTPGTWCPQSRSPMPTSSRYRDSTLHTLRKQPVHHPPS